MAIYLSLGKYSKTCVKWPLKIGKTKISMSNGSLMKFKGIAECSREHFASSKVLQNAPGSILQYF